MKIPFLSNSALKIPLLVIAGLFVVFLCTLAADLFALLADSSGLPSSNSNALGLLLGVRFPLSLAQVGIDFVGSELGVPFEGVRIGLSELRLLGEAGHP